MSVPKRANLEPQKQYPHVSNIVTLLFCGYVIIWYLQIGYRIPILGAIRFEFIYGAFLSFIVIFFADKTVMHSSLFPYVGLLFLCIIVQVPLSYDYETSVNIFVDRVVKFSFMGLFIIVFVRGPVQLKCFLAAFLLACMKMGQEGLVGTITGNLMWENQGVMRLHGTTPMYMHPNSFAGNAIGTIPFIIYLFPIAPWIVRIPLATQGLFALNVIMRSGSRTSYLGLVISLLFVVYQTKNKLKTIVIIAGICAVLLPFVQAQYLERFESAFTMQEKEGKSAETRLEILNDSLQIFLNHPFGVGVSAFPAVRFKEFGRKQDTHNLYLEVATNLGVQGLIVFLLFIYKMLAVLAGLRKDLAAQISDLGSKMLRTHDQLDLRRRIESHLSDLKLMEASCSSVFLFVVIRLVLGLFGMDLYEIYWWFAMGLTVALCNMNRVALVRTKNIMASYAGTVAA